MSVEPDNCTPIPEDSTSETVENKNEINTSPVSDKPCTHKKVKLPRVPLGVMFIALLLVGIIVFQVTSISDKVKYDKKLDEAYTDLQGFDKLIQVMQLYQDHYVYDVDKEEVSEAVTKAFITNCGDRYVQYYTSEGWKAYRAESTGNTVGLGVNVFMNENHILCIKQVFAGSPAEAAGIQSGDLVLGVDEIILSGYTLDEAVSKIRGEIGSVANLWIRRGEEEMTISVTRNAYVAEIVSYKILEIEGKKTGYIHFEEFSELSADQFINAVKQLQKDGVDGIIFDLRDNHGGDLDAALDILDCLLPAGPLVTLRPVDGDPVTYYSDASELDIPMVILTNGNSASAAEVFTLALIDYKKASVVGEKTFGKGCGMTGYFLGDGSVVFITNFFYDSPLGINIDGTGIEPDIAVSLPEDLSYYFISDISYEDDTQLQAALATLYK